MSNLDDLKNRNRIPITDHLWVYEDDPSMLLLDIDNKTLSVRFTPNSKLVNILSDEEKEKLAWYRKFLTTFEKGENNFNECVSDILHLFPKLADVEGNYISNESLEKHGKAKKMEEKNEEKQIETKQAIVQKPKTEMKIGKPERMAMLYKIPSELANMFFMTIDDALYVKAPGLLYMAGKKGYSRILTTSHYDETHKEWVAETEVYPLIPKDVIEAIPKMQVDLAKEILTTYYGATKGEGRASDDNVKNTRMKPFHKELAETRSVNRALRLFTGYGGTSYEEMPQGEIVEGDTN